MIQTSKEQLAREAKAWDEGAVTTKGWKNAPAAVTQAKAATAISIRLPTAMLEVLKAFAEREGVGYQVLMKRWLDERIREERRKLVAQSPQAPASLSIQGMAELREAAQRVLESLEKLDAYGSKPTALGGEETVRSGR